MNSEQNEPRVFRLLEGDALEVRHTSTGNVGTIFSGEGIEAVWVCKQDEDIDPEWYSHYPTQ